MNPSHHQPIFIFSSLWCSGSTLLQRFITATGEVLVWGETGGAPNTIAEATCQKFTAGPKDAHTGLWTANLSPPYADADIRTGVLNLFDSLYRQRAQDLGYPRYGFKETRHDLGTTRQLQPLFPDARFVFLIRNPLDAILSIKRRIWMGQPAGHATLKYYADHWRTRAMQYRQTDFGLALHHAGLRRRPGPAGQGAGLPEYRKQTADRFHPHQPGRLAGQQPFAPRHLGTRAPALLAARRDKAMGLLR